MDKRSVLAVVLIFIVLVGGQYLMPRQAPSRADSTRADSTAGDTTRDSMSAPAATAAAKPSAQASPAPVPGSSSSRLQARAQPPAIKPETTSISTNDRVAHYSTAGAAPVNITLPGFPDLKHKTGALTLAATRGPLLRYRIVSGNDTTALDNLAFNSTATGNIQEFTSQGVTVRYELTPDHYLSHVTLVDQQAKPGARLLIDLAQDLRSEEADTVEDLRHLAYAYRPLHGDVQSSILQRLDTTRTQIENGPLDWAAVRNKYFAFVVIAADTLHSFTDIALGGGHRVAPNHLPTGHATISLPLTPSAPGGQPSARFDLYTGPQSWTALRGAGHDLININPYAGWTWLRPVVQPFSTIVMRLLLSLKGAVHLSYGWVLVIFGILIRVILWPLNQSAMRTSIRMQKLQPELTALQKRYAKDPEAQRAAMVKLYQQHGMSPFSPLMGCLPMLLPMPVLFALYFVFQNTIEFRGVPFLWMSDISLRDPFYITPILMGASMLVLSWIGMRTAPPNPQAKVMGYMMPAMFTMMFMNLAAGLNLYYAVQNLVAIPQQWFLTRERAKAAAKPLK